MTDALNLAEPLRTTLIEAPLSAVLAQYGGEPAVFTRRPLPGDAVYPCLVVSPDISSRDWDGLTSRRADVRRDVTAYGAQPADYRTIEELGYAVRRLLHRHPELLVAPGLRIVGITAVGPIPAPVDDENHVARAVLFTIRVRDLSTGP